MRTLLFTVSLVFGFSLAHAGAAFTEITECGFVSGDTGSQISIDVINSLPDGYSHVIKLVKRGSDIEVGSVSLETDSKATMDKYYGKFPVIINGVKGVLVYNEAASIEISEDGSNLPVQLKTATLKLEKKAPRKLICIEN